TRARRNAVRNPWPLAARHGAFFPSTSDAILGKWGQPEDAKIRLHHSSCKYFLSDERTMASRQTAKPTLCGNNGREVSLTGDHFLFPGLRRGGGRDGRGYLEQFRTALPQRRQFLLRSPPKIHVRGLMGAGDGAIRGAVLLQQELAPYVVNGIVQQRNARRASLLRAPVH